MSVSKKDFLFRVDQIANEQPTYLKGHDGSDGQCDCIGLVIGAIRRAGGSWSGTHGSNYAARREMTTFGKIHSVSDLSVGDVVYKGFSPGAEKYDLPSTYSDDPDQTDYYHVGVVTSVNPLTITHMTSPTIKRDTKLGAWAYNGQLKEVSDGGDKPVENIIISGGNTDLPINMRLKPASNSKLVAEIPQGKTGTMVERGDKWSKIEYQSKQGYVLNTFIKDISVDDPVLAAIRPHLAIIDSEINTVLDIIGRG